VNILQVVPRLDIGGVETGAIDLAKELMLRGHKAVVISAGGRLLKELDSLAVKHYELPVHKKSPLIIFKMINKIAEIIIKEKIDIVHARSRAPAWSSYLACFKTGCFFITTCHGYYKSRLLSRVMGRGKKVIVPSLVIGRHMIDDFGVPAERINCIPRGVDLDKFKFNPSYLKPRDSLTVGIIGRISPIKGHKFFLKAVSKIVRKTPKVRALIVGEPSAGKQKYLDDLKVLVRQLGISSYVEFLGRRSDVPKILSELDILVVATTTQEAFGRVLIEAGAVGVPVIATKTGGIVEIVNDGEDGILISPADHLAMAEAVLKLYKDKKLIERFVKRARVKVEKKFSLQKMADETIKTYQEVINSLKILVIKIGALGDIILAVPSLRSLREKFKNAHISILVDLRYKDILGNCPYVDEVLSYDIKDASIISKTFKNIAANLRREVFDLVVDLQNNVKSHILGFLSLSAKRYGYKNKKLGFLINYGVKEVEEDLDPISHQQKVLNIMGVDILNRDLCLWPNKENFNYVERLLEGEWISEDQKLIGMNITASSKWQSKRWPIENFAKLADELAKKANCRVVITGSDEDREEAQRIKKLTRTKPIIATGKTSLLQLAALISKCSCFITADSAPLHIAAAMRTPFVALFGPTSVKRHFPPAEDYTVIYKKIKCSPCYKPKCNKQICMKKISPEEVAAAVGKYIKGG
jgi:lipopolysaccharide heptosyltransferase II